MSIIGIRHLESGRLKPDPDASHTRVRIRRMRQVRFAIPLLPTFQFSGVRSTSSPSAVGYCSDR